MGTKAANLAVKRGKDKRRPVGNEAENEERERACRIKRQIGRVSEDFAGLTRAGVLLAT